jgi:hypothetical protein
VFEATKEQLRTVRGTLAPDDPGRFEELPYKPSPDCPLCKGVGTIKSWGTPYKFGACRRCYPDHEKKGRTFKMHLRGLSSSNKALTDRRVGDHDAT